MSVLSALATLDRLLLLSSGEDEGKLIVYLVALVE